VTPAGGSPTTITTQLGGRIPGGWIVEVTPNGPCVLSSSQVGKIQRPVNGRAALKPKKKKKVKLAKYGPHYAMIPGVPVDVPVVGLSKKKKKKKRHALEVSPRAARVTANVLISCTPIGGFPGLPGAPGNPPAGTGVFTPIGSPTTTQVSVPITPTQPPPATEKKLKPGQWTGSMINGPGGKISFIVNDKGEITNLRADGQQTCTAPTGGSSQQSGVSAPTKSGVTVNHTLVATPKASFGKNATYSYAAPGNVQTGLTRAGINLWFGGDDQGGGSISAVTEGSAHCEFGVWNYSFRQGGNATSSGGSYVVP
jgi:hypothetical protein